MEKREELQYECKIVAVLEIGEEIAWKNCLEMRQKAARQRGRTTSGALRGLRKGHLYCRCTVR